ncbi:bacteriocin immunity protein [Liquorilactobacillus hordei]|uniref:bacteriocin immunity protein n=1 Tax=Liquorilactobacillus hordei TaxID=468911 RepID=UPI001CBDD93B|nr:bacteriocin immunity protein [Liquorilactobacillus hordei]MBZ2405046.1 bacteriocin immunity protein [Liquorilactobacillus hordei]
MIKNNENKEQAKAYISQLMMIFKNYQQKSPELLDIIDVLEQVYKRLDDAKKPEILVNRLVNYIRSNSLKGKIYYPTKEEKIIINLAFIGQKAGFSSQYNADFSDKSQFYHFNEVIPYHNR